MRIIAGTHRGHRIAAPPGTKTRPTSDRVRENVFNIVAPWVEDADVVDLYAGSGAMGLEALSRGAARATFVEAHVPACRTINENLDKLRLGGARVLCQDVGRFLATETRSHDLIFCDPPYREAGTLGSALADTLPAVLAPGALVVSESDRRDPLALPGLETLDERRYGDTLIRLHA